MAVERPIFVIGAQRSGTTLLRYMLCSHPRIYIPPESNFIPRFFKSRPCKPMDRRRALRTVQGLLAYGMFFEDWREEKPDASAFLDGLPDLTPATVLSVLYAKYASQHGAERWGDKSPIYADHVDLISEIFPSAQVLHIIRDGRDVALSMIKAYQHARFFYVDLYYAAKVWKRRVTAARASGRRLGPDRYFELKYEELVARPQPVLRQICEYLNEEYEPAMAEPQSTASRSWHSTGIYAATRQPLTTKGVGRWTSEMEEADRSLFQFVCGDLLGELGYGTAGTRDLRPAAKVRYARLLAKYSIISGATRLLRAAGVFHPSWLLSRRL